MSEDVTRVLREIGARMDAIGARLDSLDQRFEALVDALTEPETAAPAPAPPAAGAPLCRVCFDRAKNCPACRR